MHLLILLLLASSFFCFLQNITKMVTKWPKYPWVFPNISNIPKILFLIFLQEYCNLNHWKRTSQTHFMTFSVFLTKRAPAQTTCAAAHRATPVFAHFNQLRDLERTVRPTRPTVRPHTGQNRVKLRNFAILPLLTTNYQTYDITQHFYDLVECYQVINNHPTNN